MAQKQPIYFQAPILKHKSDDFENDLVLTSIAFFCNSFAISMSRKLSICLISEVWFESSLEMTDTTE